MRTFNLKTLDRVRHKEMKGIIMLTNRQFNQTVADILDRARATAPHSKPQEPGVTAKASLTHWLTRFGSNRAFSRAAKHVRQAVALL